MRVFCTDSLDWLFLCSAEQFGHMMLFHGITSLVCFWRSIASVRYVLQNHTHLASWKTDIGETWTNYLNQKIEDLGWEKVTWYKVPKSFLSEMHCKLRFSSSVAVGRDFHSSGMAADGKSLLVTSCQALTTRREVCSLSWCSSGRRNELYQRSHKSEKWFGL